MKKIEKEFWVDERGFEHLMNGTSFQAWDKEDASRYLDEVLAKIKITFEIPEKKITISESEFDIAVKQVIDREHLLDELKYKLFRGGQ